jgi:hypothetical protein
MGLPQLIFNRYILPRHSEPLVTIIRWRLTEYCFTFLCSIPRRQEWTPWTWVHQHRPDPDEAEQLSRQTPSARHNVAQAACILSPYHMLASYVQMDAPDQSGQGRSQPHHSKLLQSGHAHHSHWHAILNSDLKVFEDVVKSCCAVSLAAP